MPVLHFSVHYTNGGPAAAGAVSEPPSLRTRPGRSEGSSQCRDGAGSRHTRRGGAGRQRGSVAPRGTGGAGAGAAAAMLPALPDGDERELESSEEGGGAAEERRPERHGCTYHGLYGYRR